MSSQGPYDPNSDNPRKVFVYNLPWSVDWPDLKKYFKRAGQVIYANVMKEGGPTGRSKGCGVVEFETVEEATNAINLFNGIEMDGRTIYVRRDIKDPTERTFDHTPAQKRSAPQDFQGGASKRSRTDYGGGFGGSSGMRNGSKFSSGANDVYGDYGGMGMGMGGMKSGMGMGNMGMGGMGMGMGGMGSGFGMRGGRDMSGMDMQSGMGGFGGFNDMGGGYVDSYDYSSRQNMSGGQAAMIGRRLFVANLSYETTWQQLKDHFKAVGKVTFATILKDKEGKSRGCGLVEYEQPSEALRAISRLSNSMLGDRQISVREDQKEGQEPLRNAMHSSGFSGSRRDFQQQSGFTGQVAQQGVAAQAHTTSFQQSAMPDLPGVLPGTSSTPTGTQVVVHGLPFSYEWVHLKDMMRAAGNVAKADIVKDSAGKSKGYGIVRFETEEQALNAIEMFNNTPLHGRIIHVKRDEFA